MDLKTFGQAIRELVEEKGVGEDKVLETIELAIAAAYKKDYGKKGQIIRAKFNPASGDLKFSQIKIVVDESMIKSEEEISAEEEAAKETEDQDKIRAMKIRRESEEAAEDLTPPKDESEIKKVRFNPERHIMLEEAEKLDKGAKAGEEMEFKLETRSDFGRIASQTAKQVIIQRIREAEREAIYDEYKSREGEIASGLIQRIEGRNVFIDLGRGIGVLTAEEQIPREHYSLGERVKSLIILVEKEGRGPGIFLSRSHPRFLRKLFELEVPEILAGSVEIKAVAREAGSRSKVAVVSNDPAIDPVGSMVGQRGVRVSTVMNDLGGEKIDIIEWAEEPARFVANSLSPAKILDVEVNDERREATSIAPDDQLSLAIGKGGQNVRLAAKLTGWKIDVRPVSGKSGGRTPPAAAVEETAPSEEEKIEESDSADKAGEDSGSELES